MGFADHYVHHDRLADFTTAVVGDGVDSALDSYEIEPPPSPLVAQRDWIDECYAGETVADIVAALRRHEATAASDAAEMIATRSPVALAVTLRAVRKAAHLDTLEDVLRQEYRVSCAALRSHDLVEGIRAQLIDKDRNPKWSPASLAAVSDAHVDAFFAPAGDELTFDEDEICADV
jgi:enoyl-CoA hydratase